MSSRSRTRAAVVLPAAALCAVLAGCSDIYYDRRETVALHAGDASASNRVTHMIDPWSRASGNRNITYSGERMQAAAQRYRTGRVIPPVNAMTSSTSYMSPQSSAPSGPSGSNAPMQGAGGTP